ncbi:MAG: response regulator [Cyanobacteria bacterium P01_F01_bin.13]
MLPEQQQRILGYFIEEAKDHLNTIEQGLLNLQATIVNSEMANEVFRAAHSVKGGAAMLGIESMQRTAHRMEDYFKILKDSPVEVDRALESMFLQVFDALQELLEQLQGPFGLTDDKEQSIMAGVEPVFQQLQEHLDQLVAETGTTTSSQLLEEVAPVAFTAPSTAPSPQPVEESALKLVFSSDVSVSLREMLARFKQADTDESRSALEGCCQLLERFGEQFNLPTWMNLVKHARWAVCDRNNDYRTLAPVLIKEIKKAQDLVLAGREPEIPLSQTLQTLAAKGDVVDTADDLDTLFAEDALFTDSDQDSSTAVDIDDLALEPSLSPIDEEAPLSATDDGISLDDLLNNAATLPSGPEVGAAELTSLADLFETGEDALNSDWQEEDVPITEEASTTESLDIDISPDFEDLLNNDSKSLGTSPDDFESGNELADLFGDTDNTATTTDGLDHFDSDLEELSSAASSTDVASSESIGSIDSLFDDMATDEASVDDLFGTLDPTPASNEAAENSPEISDSPDFPEELTIPTVSETEEVVLEDIDLAFGATTDKEDIDDLLSDQPETTATDRFFGSKSTVSEALDSINPEPKQSEFDDFFTVDETPAETLQETASDTLDSDLWTQDTSADNIAAPAADDLSEDIWADDSNLGPRDTSDFSPTNLENTTAAQNIVEDSDDLDLEDVWASVEDLDLAEEDLVEDVAEKHQTESEDVSPDGEFDNLFDDVTKSPELTSELPDSDVSLENDGFDDLFSDNTESDESLDVLLSDADVSTESETNTDDLDSLDLSESDTSIQDDASSDLDLSLSTLNDPGSDIDLDILGETPPNAIEFDLGDLEDDGIVTGFVTDDDSLNNVVEDDAETDSLDLDLSTGIAETASPFDKVDGLIGILDADFGELEFEESPDESQTPTTTAADIPVENLFDETDNTSNGQDLESLDSLLPELPEESNEISTPAIDSNDEFGDLDALLDAPEASDNPAPEALSISDVSDVDDEFSDLEALLQDADQTLATTSTSSTSYRPTSNRLAGRRMVTDQTMRVSVSHLDNLSNLVGELVVNRNTLEQDQERLRQFLDNLLFQVQQLNDVGQRMRDLYERSLLESSLISSRQSYQMASAGVPVETSEREDHATGESFDALEMDRFTGFHTLSQEMIELIVRVRESASDIAYTVESSDQVTRQFRQVTNQLQEGLNKARMVPFAQAASRLPRAVRDISVKCGKEARLVVEGRDILIDKMILEQLYDPMTHLVNNAITHGVETPEERRRAGKTEEGVITVRAFYQGNQTVISVGDDGAGIAPNIVKQKALQKGLISQSDVQTMTVLDVYDLLFHPGFSTRDQADDFAGRGFGMDVVRTSLADIRGNITIDSEPGRGTNFTIRLPLTLSISKALSCISNQARIAFPMDGVEDMFDVSRERIQQNDQGQDCILWRDTLLPFQNLSDLLSFNRTLGRGRVYGGNQDENMVSIVVLRSANSFIALEVDQVMGEQEIVIKQLEGPVPKPTGIAGATVLGDGRVMPIADVLELIDLAMGRVRREPNTAVWSQAEEAPPEEPSKVKSEPTVLIVDDSITVRELLSMSFNKVGYRVEQARDGQEAWEKLRSGLPCDLVFCDIEMPRMDGLELLSRLQKDGGLQQIPIAMLTSRGADRHRQMAVDLGASGYFTKPYLEEALLDAANKMLHGEKLV